MPNGCVRGVDKGRGVDKCTGVRGVAIVEKSGGVYVCKGCRQR